MKCKLALSGIGCATDVPVAARSCLSLTMRHFEQCVPKCSCVDPVVSSCNDVLQKCTSITRWDDLQWSTNAKRFPVDVLQMVHCVCVSRYQCVWQTPGFIYTGAQPSQGSTWPLSRTTLITPGATGSHFHWAAACAQHESVVCHGAVVPTSGVQCGEGTVVLAELPWRLFKKIGRHIVGKGNAR